MHYTKSPRSPGSTTRAKALELFGYYTCIVVLPASARTTQLGSPDGDNCTADQLASSNISEVLQQQRLIFFKTADGIGVSSPMRARLSDSHRSSKLCASLA